MVDEPHDTGAGWDARQPVEVIQDERDRTLAIEVVDPARQDTSTTGAATVSAGAGLATAERAQRIASIACVHRTIGSLSPSSSVSHATGFRAVSASRHAASRVVFPKPAGQARRVSLRSDPLRRRSRRRSRGIVSFRTGGGCSFVPTRIGCSVPSRIPSPATGSFISDVPRRACATTRRLDRLGACPWPDTSCAGHIALTLPNAYSWIHRPKVLTYADAAHDAGDSVVPASSVAVCRPAGGSWVSPQFRGHARR